MTRLSVNINKAAVLRNSRGGREPDPVAFARLAVQSGCHGITVHPRPDQRHIRLDDVLGVPAVLEGMEFNIEGNPFAPPRPGYPGLLDIVRRVAPAQVTLVPDGDGQVTSDHGFDPGVDLSELKELVQAFKRDPVRVSVFVDAGVQGIERFAECGVDRVEIYTGPFADAFARGDYRRELDDCRRTARDAVAAGMGVNAGHDLSQANLDCLLQAIPCIDEVSIGHALFCEALLDGFVPTIERYLRILDHAPSN